MVDQSMRVALVGCGAVANLAATHGYLRLRERATVVATVDVRPERSAALATTLGAQPYASLDEAFASGPIEAVDVRVPNHLHCATVLDAVAHGAHVLVEKPMANTPEEAQRMVAAASAAGVVLTVSENYSYFEPVRTARELLRAGAIGRLLAVRATRVFRLGGIWVRDGWRLDPAHAGGGVLMDQGCHQANILRRLAGDITYVHAFATGHPDDVGGEASAVVNCRFATGAIGQMLCSWASATPHQGPEAVLYGTDGAMEIHVTYGTDGGGTLLLRADLPEGRQWATERGDYFYSFAEAIDDWTAACRGRKSPIMSGREGTADLEVTKAIYASLETGDEVRVSASRQTSASSPA